MSRKEKLIYDKPNELEEQLVVKMLNKYQDFKKEIQLIDIIEELFKINSNSIDCKIKKNITNILEQEKPRKEMMVNTIDLGLRDLDERELQFVKYRYMKQLPIKEVQEIIKYSKVQTNRIRRSSLNKLIKAMI